MNTKDKVKEKKTTKTTPKESNLLKAFRLSSDEVIAKAIQDMLKKDERQFH